MRSAWRYWNNNVPRIIRWAVYGALGGLALCALVHVIGFCAGGIAAGSIAAGVHSAIGCASAGGFLAFMQSLGTSSAWAFLGYGAVAGVVAGVLPTIAKLVSSAASLVKSAASNICSAVSRAGSAVAKWWHSLW